MTISIQGVVAIKSARIICIITDSTTEKTAYYIDTQDGDDARERQQVTDSRGGRWAAYSKQAVIEAVQGVLPDLEGHDLAAGFMITSGPHGADLDRIERNWMLSLSGKRITELTSDEQMLLTHGYTYQQRLKLNVAFAETNVLESEHHPLKQSSIQHQLHAIERGDESVQLYRDNALINVSEAPQPQVHALA